MALTIGMHGMQPTEEHFVFAHTTVVLPCGDRLLSSKFGMVHSNASVQHNNLWFMCCCMAADLPAYPGLGGASEQAAQTVQGLTGGVSQAAAGGLQQCSCSSLQGSAATGLQLPLGNPTAHDSHISMYDQVQEPALAPRTGETFPRATFALS